MAAGRRSASASASAGARSTASGVADGRFWRAVDAMEELGYDSIWLSDTAGLGGAGAAARAGRGRRAHRAAQARHERARAPAAQPGPARARARDRRRHLRRAAAPGRRARDRPARGARGDGRRARASGSARLEEAVAIIKALWARRARHARGPLLVAAGRPADPAARRAASSSSGSAGNAPAALRRIGRIADGWLGSFVGPGGVRAQATTIKAAAAEAGRSIDEDHYGATLFAAPSAAEIPDGALERSSQRRPGLAREDHIAVRRGRAARAAGALRRRRRVEVRRLSRSRATCRSWLAEMHAEAVVPVEAAWPREHARARAGQRADRAVRARAATTRCTR